MYRYDNGWMSTTFRLQLFTSAAGLRPVAVATQDSSEDGVSLVNGCEYFVGRVWRDFFPDEPLPPLWVQRIIPEDSNLFGGKKLGDWKLVDFEVGPDYELTGPNWSPISQRQLNRLVDDRVDPDRGSGFVPPPPPPAYRTRFTLVPMDQMPQEKPFRESCMTGAAPQPTPEPAPQPAPSMASEPAVRRQRLGQWLGRSRRPAPPATAGRDCCWYHGGDWAAVINTAVRLIAEVEADGVAEDAELVSRVMTAARAEGLSEWSLQALNSLIADPIMTQRAGGAHVGFTNGQHRTRAMRDAGVAAVLVGREELAEPDEAGVESSAQP